MLTKQSPKPMPEECDPKEFKQTPGIIADASQIDECCDTNTIRIIPDELREPLPVHETEPQDTELKLPKGIRVTNREQHAICTEPGQLGNEVIIGSGTLTTTVYFSSVLSITSSVLDYIARHTLEDAIANLWHNGTLIREELRRMTGMTLAEADELLAELQNAQEQLDSSAKTLAESRLDCYYVNNEVHVRCDDVTVLRPEQHPDAVYEALIPAGQYQSHYSQEDADNKAEDAANALLVCIYGNERFTARCHERPDRPMDHMDEVPNDPIPIYPGRELRVGTVEVPANKFTSITSLEDANRKAQDWGYAQLVCWYPNWEVTADCDDPDARNSGVDPDLEPAVDADLDNKTPGQHVRVPYGYFTSELSSDVATDEAELFAESLLQCCYINDELVFECQPEPVVTESGQQVTISPKHEGNWRVVVPRGDFTSCVSKEEANLYAEQSAEGVLECKYCNVEVLPTCVPYWVTEGVKNGVIKLPLPRDVITDGEHSILASQLPPEATIGTAADTICLPDAQQAQRLAESVAVVPVSGESGCTCYSKEVIVGCAVEDPYGNGLRSGEMGVTPDGQPYYFYSMFPSSYCLSEAQSYPTPGTYIRFGPGIVSGDCGSSLHEIGTSANPEMDALTMEVVQLGMAMLRCMVENPDTYGFCESGSSVGDICARTWRYGLSKWDSSQLTEWSNSESNPVILPRGVVTMPVTDVYSYDDAARAVGERTKALLATLIICAYYNTRQEAPCNPPGESKWVEGEGTCIECTCTTTWRQANEGIVPAKMLIGESPSAVNNAAINLAHDLAACDRDTTVDCQIVYPCGPVQPSSSETPGGGSSPGESPGGGSSPGESPGESPGPTPQPTLPGSSIGGSSAPPSSSKPLPTATSQPYGSTPYPTTPYSSSPGSSGCDYQTCPYYAQGGCGGAHDPAAITTSDQLTQKLKDEQAYLVEIGNTIRAKIAEAKEKIAYLTSIVKAKKSGQ